MLVIIIPVIQCQDCNYCHINFSNLFAGNVRISLQQQHLPNNSVLHINRIGQGENALRCITNKQGCCGGSMAQRRIGDWIFPNGTNVGSSTSPEIVYRDRTQSGEVRLNYRPRGDLMQTGSYCCKIPDGCDVMQTLCTIIGIYDAYQPPIL